MRLKIYNAFYKDLAVNMDYVMEFTAYSIQEARTQFDCFNMYDEYELEELRFERYAHVDEVDDYLQENGF